MQPHRLTGPDRASRNNNVALTTVPVVRGLRLTCGLAGLALSLSSCAGPGAWSASTGELAGRATVHALHTVPARSSETPDDSSTAEGPIQQMAYVEAPSTFPPEPSELPVPAPEDATASFAGAAVSPSGDVVPPALPLDLSLPVAGPAPVSGGHLSVAPCEVLPCDPRVALPACPSPVAGCPMPWPQGPACLPACEAELFPDEYLCDGGDRGHRAMMYQNGLSGLETEDTVGEFVDESGRRQVRPSTRACVYAPQFAAVRSASGPHENLAVGGLAGTHDGRGVSGLRSRAVPLTGLQREQASGLLVRSRVSGLERPQGTEALAQVAAAAHHVKLNNLFENRLFLAGGQLARAEEAYLAEALQIAAAWTRDQNPVIVASDAAGQELIARFNVEEYVVVEDRRTPGDLKIVKLVDKPAAEPGEVLSFVLRFENTGERDLYYVAITDNLTPRLEYIEGTADCDRAGTFSTEDNGEGSVVLRFELSESLEGGSGGMLTFQCRVR